MIEIEIFRNLENHIRSFKINGHAMSATGDEFDLVCGAVSALSIAAVNGLVGYLNLELPEVEVKDGLIHCTLPETLSDKLKDQAEAIVETMVLGLKSISRDYPGHVKVFKRRWTPCLK